MKQTAVYETIFTIQLLFVKGTALELRRSFGALADLNEAILHSMKSNQTPEYTLRVNGAKLNILLFMCFLQACHLMTFQGPGTKGIEGSFLNHRSQSVRRGSAILCP